MFNKMNNIIGVFYPSTQSKDYIFLTGQNRQKYNSRNLQNLKDISFKLYYMNGDIVGKNLKNYSLDYLELDKKQTKSTEFEEGGGKRARGNIFTRAKAKRQQKRLSKQRDYINMSDEERKNYDRMKAHNRAELIRGMSRKHKANIYLDPKEYSKSGGKPQLDNMKSFNELMAQYEKMNKTNPNVNPVEVNPVKTDPTQNWPTNLAETEEYLKTLKK